ncbi:MAG TPA: M48 family metallopeptidase [Terriglobales bacterium]|nr:M48 family metallopeptidase [Terriglobales bacterium]
MTIYSRSTRIVVVALCVLLSAPDLLFARVQPTSGSDMFTLDQEIQAGREAAAQTNKQYPVLPDSNPVTQYIQQLGRRLVQYAPGEKWPYQFHVVNQKEINAFALPGGPLYVNLGTIQAADNEAQLAGVMAHEISHIVQRHSTRAATKQYKAQVGLGILGALLGGSVGGQLAAAGISFAAGSYFLKNSRQSEKEADLLGTDIMYDAGYDPIQLPRFFEKIEAESSQGPQFLSDHPDPGNRIEYVRAEIATLPPKSNLREDSPQFDEIHRTVMGMRAMTAQQIADQDKRGGFNPNGVNAGSPERLPSGGAGYSASANFKQLDHSTFTIGYPADWQVYGDAQSAVTIAPPNGVGQDANGQSAVAVGLIIDRFEPEQGGGLDQSTHDLIASLRQSNPDLRQVGNEEAIRVNGVAGRSTDLIGTSPIRDSSGRAQRERDWLVSVQRQDGTLVYLVFIAPQTRFDELRPTYEQMLRTLRLR